MSNCPSSASPSTTVPNFSGLGPGPPYSAGSVSYVAEWPALWSQALPTVSSPGTHCNIDMMPGIRKASGEHTMDGILRTSTIPEYRPLLLKWLQGHHPSMIPYDGSDPSAIGQALSQRFHEWFQPHWALLHLLGLTAQINWTLLFRFWFVASHAGDSEGTPHVSSPTRSPAPAPAPHANINPDATPTGPSRASPAPRARVRAATFSSARQRRYRNETSTRTVKKIQKECKGGEAAAVKRLADVFPPGSTISRNTLKVDGKPKEEGHCGYREFTGLLANGRWHCRLCGAGTNRSWRAEKDLLNHVWNDHCDPPPRPRRRL
jgi:hypothetical protein